MAAPLLFLGPECTKSGASPLQPGQLHAGHSGYCRFCHLNFRKWDRLWPPATSGAHPESFGAWGYGRSDGYFETGWLTGDPSGYINDVPNVPTRVAILTVWGESC